MSKFQITLIGRPNVGKSTLFNRLVKEQKAVVAKIPGVTRDYQVEKVHWKKFGFDLVDTSGFEMGKKDFLSTEVQKQYETVLNASDGFIFMCDGQTALTQLDQELLSKIRHQNKPIIFTVNKVDTRYFKEHEKEYSEFLNQPFIPMAAEKNEGMHRLLNTIEKSFALPQEEKKKYHREIRVALMGRPNVGKSTLMNCLLGQDRMIVSPIAGTTRDTIDESVEVDHQRYVFIDTAGLRKKSKVHEKVEKLSTLKAIETLDQADVLLLVLDALEGPREQDQKIVSLAWDRGVGVVILINKWDLLPEEKKTNLYWQRQIGHAFRHFDKIPFIFVSGKDRRNIQDIFKLALQMKLFSEQVIDGNKLKENFQMWVGKTPHPRVARFGYRNQMRFFDIRQSHNAPPKFEVHVNMPQGIAKAYDRYLKNQIRQTHGYWGIPVEIHYKKK